MIRASRKEADDLLSGWREEKLWIGCLVVFGETAEEEHKFLARVVDGLQELTLAGKHAVVSIPLEDATFEYSELREAPKSLREKFADFPFCLTIRAGKVVALLFGRGPNGKEESS